ncbi:hypothetical protein DFS34DRAFT_690287 [Phlyctochytrium arcticum]|nr:hypothetical protein DFS34DRAFT_698013 [Phlyctochytrium arcticum]KAI9105811.1 hypothetical protein DFS34DRAFT_690287 [Phlyctochytrium arcticum]
MSLPLPEPTDEDQRWARSVTCSISTVRENGEPVGGLGYHLGCGWTLSASHLLHSQGHIENAEFTFLKTQDKTQDDPTPNEITPDELLVFPWHEGRHAYGHKIPTVWEGAEEPCPDLVLIQVGNPVPPYAGAKSLNARSWASADEVAYLPVLRTIAAQRAQPGPKDLKWKPFKIFWDSVSGSTHRVARVDVGLQSGYSGAPAFFKNLNRLELLGTIYQSYDDATFVRKYRRQSKRCGGKNCGSAQELQRTLSRWARCVETVPPTKEELALHQARVCFNNVLQAAAWCRYYELLPKAFNPSCVFWYTSVPYEDSLEFCLPFTLLSKAVLIDKYGQPLPCLKEKADTHQFCFMHVHTKITQEEVQNRGKKLVIKESDLAETNFRFARKKISSGPSSTTNYEKIQKRGVQQARQEATPPKLKKKKNQPISSKDWAEIRKSEDKNVQIAWIPRSPR